MGKEGKVKIGFTLNKNGQASNIKIISGNRIFNNSAIQAIKDSFPIKVDKSLFDFPKNFTINLAYNLE